MKNLYPGWYVLYVKSQNEKKIDCLLKENKIDSFLPTITTIRQWSDRKKKIIKPLFPSYIFVNIKSRKEFFAPLNIKGVFKYLKFSDEYAKVRNEEISKIRQFLNLEGISDVKTKNFNAQVGDKMMINYGSMSGFECEVIKESKNKKIFVRFDSIRQNITATIPSYYLTPISRKEIV